MLSEDRSIQINPSEAEEYLESLLKEGKDVLHLSFSSAMSGTYANFAAAAEKRRGHAAPPQKKDVDRFAAAVGAAMGGANTAKTLLAGILPSIVVFPVTNVGVILASLAVSVLFLKERLTKRQAAAAGFGIAAVALFSLPL